MRPAAQRRAGAGCRERIQLVALGRIELKGRVFGAAPFSPHFLFDGLAGLMVK
jgi:hypothetical protein